MIQRGEWEKINRKKVGEESMELIDNKSKLLGDDLSKMQSAIAYETQSKKKFEYNARLKQYKEEREKLLGRKI